MKISVVIPCYQSGAYVLEAVDSVLAQTARDELLEIIVIDDHNRDEATLKALHTLKTEYPAIVKVLANSGVKGVGAARNLGIDYAQGDWLAFLDADDRYVADAFAIFGEAASQYPDCAWIGGDFSIWDGGEPGAPEGFFNHRPLTARILAKAYDSGSPLRLDKPVRAFLETALTHTIANLVKKSVLQQTGGFDNTLRLQQDYNLYIKIAALSDFVFVPKICALYRQHEGNSTKSELATLDWRARALIKILAMPEFSAYRADIRRKIAVIQADIAYRYRSERRFYPAFKAAILALRFNPGNLLAWRCLAAAMVFK